MKDFITKGGAKSTFIERFEISADQLANHVQKDVLGLPIRADFVTLHGPSGGCSVVMLISIQNSDFTASAVSGNNYVDKFLEQNSASIMAKQDIIKALEPYMFPDQKQWVKITADKEACEKLAHVGICNQALQSIVTYSEFRKSELYNEWVVMLNTENLIKDYLSDPTTGKVEGTLEIKSVTGERAPALKWEVEINRSETRSFDDTVSLDAIFASAR